MTSNSLGICRLLDNENSKITIGCATPGLHDLCLTLTNKTQQDTVLDQHGNILEDLAVIITSFRLDDIEFQPIINSFSTYSDNNGLPVQTHGYLSYSTPFEITFCLPGFYFMRNLHLFTVLEKPNYLREIQSGTTHRDKQ